MAPLVAVDSIASMTVVEAVDTVVMAAAAAGTMTTIAAPLAMMTVSGVHTDVVTTIHLVVSTGTPQAAEMIATAAVAMNTAAEAIHTAETVGVREVMGTPAHEIHASLMVEVETKTTALTIGTPVVRCCALIYSGAERSTK